VVACGLRGDGLPSDEEVPWNFPEFGLADSYSITKHQAQVLVQDAAAAGDVDAVIVNPTYMLGPYDPRPSSGRLILNVVRRTLPFTSSGYNNFVDVRDVCRGMIAALERGRRGECYILGNENLTYQEIMQRIAAVAGTKPPGILLPSALAKVPGWIGDVQQRLFGREVLLNSIIVRYAYTRAYQFSSEKAQRELGYRPGSIEPAIRDAIAWFKGRGML